MDAFLSKLRSENVYVRALSYLVVRALLGSLSGEQQLNVGHRAVQAMAVESIADFGEVFIGVDNVPAVSRLPFLYYLDPELIMNAVAARRYKSCIRCLCQAKQSQYALPSSELYPHFTAYMVATVRHDNQLGGFIRGRAIFHVNVRSVLTWSSFRAQLAHTWS